MTIADMEMLLALLDDGQATVKSAKELPDDPILAAYELPHIEGFEEQDALVRKLMEEGKLFPPQPHEHAGTPISPEVAGTNPPSPSMMGMPSSMTFDPKRGMI
ncbi:MAG: hypothetical protein K6T83_15475 [Alicyclobacillus sp.]|nr:hypothetical protein [Alicyclobacillus sp.]